MPDTASRTHTPWLSAWCNCVLLTLFLLASALNANAATSAPSFAKARELVEQGLALGDNSPQEEKLYRQATELDPAYAAAWFNLAYVLHARGELEAALPPYRRSLELDPERAAAHENYALCLLAVRKDAMLPEVRKHYNLAIELQENLPRTQRPKDLDQKRSRLLDIERRMHRTYKPVLHEAPSSATVRDVLSRRVTRRRGGQGHYDGPRLAIPLFTTGENRVHRRHVPALRSLAQALNSPALEKESFVIEGYADGRGAAGFNHSLALQRARVVQRWLVQHGGVDEQRLQSVSCGEDRPIFPNDTLEHYHGNRRIEIVREDAYED